MIEFKLDGTILSANENFLAVMGYSAGEIIGRHHSMFADPEFAKSPEYRAMWERLNRGEFIADKFHRLGKGGKDVWILASYNPLFDLNGKPYKVIKYATDITAVEAERLAAEADKVAADRDHRGQHRHRPCGAGQGRPDPSRRRRTDRPLCAS